DDIAKAPGQSIEQVLMGRFPGVEVTRGPDGGFAVRIRGGSSIRSGNTPLYVLDGVVIDPGPNGYLTGVNPNDIASIQILKEPAETALYGLRGANGVIIITTKRPGQWGHLCARPVPRDPAGCCSAVSASASPLPPRPSG